MPRALPPRAALAAAVILVALVGCTAAPTSTPSPTASEPRPTPTPTPTPTATLSPLVVPDCETLLPIETARAAFSPAVEFGGEIPLSEYRIRLTGPSQQAVLATAATARACRWGIPRSDGIFSLAVAEITDAERATLQAELAENGFAESTTGQVVMFQGEGEGGISAVAVTHIFTGTAWIVADLTVLDGSLAVGQSALEALRAANPALGA